MEDTVTNKRVSTPKAMPPVIARAIVAIQAELEPLLKTADNHEYGSTFVPLPDVAVRARDLLKGFGIGVIQPPTTGDNGEPALETMLLHKSGVGWSRVTPLSLLKIDPQAHSGSITYMRRVALMGTLGLTAVGEDDDGNKASGVLEKVTQEQKERLTVLLGVMSFPSKQLAGIIRNIYTADTAALAIIKYEKMASERMRNREAEANAIEVESNATHIDVTDGQDKKSVGERLDELVERDGLIKSKLINAVANKPFLENCDDADLAVLSKTLDVMESGDRGLPGDWYKSGHPPVHATAAEFQEDEDQPA